jgi:hypothetical protein
MPDSWGMHYYKEHSPHQHTCDEHDYLDDFRGENSENIGHGTCRHSHCWVFLSLNSRNYCKEHSPLHRGLCSESTASGSFLKKEEGKDSGDDEKDDKMSAKQRQVNGDIWCAGQVDESIQNFDSVRPTMTNDQTKSMWRAR